MKITINFIVILLIWTCNCFAIDESILIRSIDRQDTFEIVNFFEEIETITLDEAKELVCRLYDHYINQFGPEILNSEYRENLEKCTELYHLILESKGFPLEKSLLGNEANLGNWVLLCREKKAEKQVPGSMILGGVEIVTGALVWILPFPGTKQVGGIMIGDGLRRTFDGLEELDKENQKENLDH